MKEYRAWLRRHVPPSLLRKVNSIAHLDDRLFEAETRRAQLARIVPRDRFPRLFVDGEAGKAAAKRLVARMLAGRMNRTEVRHAFVTAKNVNGIVGSGPLAVLSIDLHCMDYWLWSAICGPAPDVVIIKCNASLGSDQSVTVPYDSRFSIHRAHSSSYYHGASLAALERLGRAKGSSMVAVDSAGVNAFFVRDAARPESLPACTAAAVFRPHRMRLRKHSGQQQWELVRQLRYETV